MNFDVIFSRINNLRLFKTYPILREIRQLRKERKQFYNEAVKKFLEEKPMHGSLEDYKKALYLHRVSYKEYMFGYEFWKLDEKQRNEFISQREMWCIYRKAINQHVRKLFKDKVLFLKTFDSFIHRKWIWPQDISLEEFKKFISTRKCIAKPLQGEQGKGIFLIEEGEEGEKLYNYCRDNNYLIEELICECDELKKFHPQSLNTIRIVTLSGKGKCVVLGALLRMGANNSILDNTHSGGIFAAINTSTGEVQTDGFDLNGNKYFKHPNSGITIKGFIIPHWNDCIEVCKKATMVVPETRFGGWDICVLPNGQIDIIEGNSAPDVDGGLQVPLKKGIKHKIELIGKDLFGFNPISLISIWSRSYKKY